MTNESIAQSRMYLWRIFSPTVKSEMELKKLLPDGARIIGLIPRIEIPSGMRRDRLLVVTASVIYSVLLVALISLIWEIHRLL
jgi:hypothetical protein